jgi:hypothetical protein
VSKSTLSVSPPDARRAPKRPASSAHRAQLSKFAENLEKLLNTISAKTNASDSGLLQGRKQPYRNSQKCQDSANAASRACASGSSLGRAVSSPMSRTRSGCCARERSGQVAAPPSTAMKSRRLTCSLPRPLRKLSCAELMLFCHPGAARVCKTSQSRFSHQPPMSEMRPKAVAPKRQRHGALDSSRRGRALVEPLATSHP